MSNTVFRSKIPITAYRVGSGSHPLLDGSGAASSESARWNSSGRFVIYAAEHYAAALLERAAQLNSVRIPRTLMFVRIEIASKVSVEEVTGEELPGWQADDRLASRRFGDRWYDEARSLVLLVPSLAAPGLERNVLINQRHPEFSSVISSPAHPIVCHPKLLT